MNNTREKLISLLGLCSDNETEATKLQLMTSIIQSADYSTLSKSVVLKKPFEDLYEYSKLEGLSNNELKTRESLLHKMVYFNGQLVQSIHSGNGPELTNEDQWDFASLYSITNLCNKIHLYHGIMNFTNISEENALAIFSDATVKSAKKCFDMLPISITKTNDIDEETIRRHMGNTMFCVSIEEFRACHKSFLGFAEKSETIIEKEKFRKKKYRLIKIAIIMLCFGSIYTCSQFDLFSDTFTPALTLVMLVIAILFLILG